MYGSLPDVRARPCLEKRRIEKQPDHEAFPIFSFLARQVVPDAVEVLMGEDDLLDFGMVRSDSLRQLLNALP